MATSSCFGLSFAQTSSSDGSGRTRASPKRGICHSCQHNSVLQQCSCCNLRNQILHADTSDFICSPTNESSNCFLVLQTERGSAVGEENHWGKEGGDQEDQPQQPGEAISTYVAEMVQNASRNVQSLSTFLFSQQKERLRQRDANLSLPS